jgi:EAL domain-containing protein (putative c-di-GMP-specific phosphodiesterase class I)
VALEGQTLEADTEGLSQRELTRALDYTISQFESKGAGLEIDSFKSGLKAFMEENTQKIQAFKNIITRLDFHLHFQPIVDLKSFKASHYEMLTRFEEGVSPYEMITFGEDVGLAPDFDLAVCDRAINYLIHTPQSRVKKFAINLSGQSIQNPSFMKSLSRRLASQKSLSDNLIFEITESTTIQDLGAVNEFIKLLQKEGYKVCLDDFGAGSASFQYLHQLHVDYVKLDGAYTKQITHNKRDATMVKNLARLCQDLGVKMVAEFVEEEAQIKMLREMGIEYGQGYWFGRPDTKPELNLESEKFKLAER